MHEAVRLYYGEQIDREGARHKNAVTITPAETSNVEEEISSKAKNYLLTQENAQDACIAYTEVALNGLESGLVTLSCMS